MNLITGIVSFILGAIVALGILFVMGIIGFSDGSIDFDVQSVEEFSFEWYEKSTNPKG